MGVLMFGGAERCSRLRRAACCGVFAFTQMLLSSGVSFAAEPTISSGIAAAADETKPEAHPQGPDGAVQASTACEATADPGMIFANTDQGVREADPARDDRGGGPCEVVPSELQLAASPDDDDSPAPALAATDPLPDPVEFARFDAEVTTALEAAEQQVQQEVASEPPPDAAPPESESPMLAPSDPVEFARFDAEVATWLEAADQQIQQELVSEPPPDAPLAERDSPAPTLAPADPLPDPVEFARFDAEVTTALEAADQQMQREIERETRRLLQQQKPRAR
jgi:hypothetical protein